jgi:hypothetical protein
MQQIELKLGSMAILSWQCQLAPAASMLTESLLALARLKHTCFSPKILIMRLAQHPTKKAFQGTANFVLSSFIPHKYIE